MSKRRHGLRSRRFARDQKYSDPVEFAKRMIDEDLQPYQRAFLRHIGFETYDPNIIEGEYIVVETDECRLIDAGESEP